MIQRVYAHGYVSIQTIGLFLMGLMLSALCIDFAYYHAAENDLQTSADAGALAAVQELWHSTGLSPTAKEDDATTAADTLVNTNSNGLYSIDTSQDVLFGYVDPDILQAQAGFSAGDTNDTNYASTGGYNAVQVTVRRTDDSPSGALPMMMSKLVGIDRTDVSASGIAAMDNQIGAVTGGVRPIYGCQAEWDTAKARIDAGLSSPHFRIYGDNFYEETAPGVWTAVAACALPGPGNWGFADFTDCGSGTVGASTIASWFQDGYPGTVSAGTCYSTKPGDFLSANGVQTALDTLIANQTVSIIPLVPPTGFSGGGGSTETVTPSGFAGFVFTNYDGNGAAASRYIEGYFVKATCPSGVQCSHTAGATGGGIVKIQLVGKG